MARAIYNQAMKDELQIRPEVKSRPGQILKDNTRKYSSVELPLHGSISQSRIVKYN